MSRPVSPFITFCYAKRDEVKAANPNAEFGEIARILSSLWKEKTAYVEPRRVQLVASVNEPGLRRSSRLRNKNLGLDFWGLRVKVDAPAPTGAPASEPELRRSSRL